MTPLLRTPALRLAGAMLLAAGTATVMTAPAPALAQDSAADARIRKIEAEVRALQRKVFPGGDGRFFEPQIGPGSDPAAPTTTSSPAAPSSTAVTDILVRLDTLETQLRGLTARCVTRCSVKNCCTSAANDGRLGAMALRIMHLRERHERLESPCGQCHQLRYRREVPVSVGHHRMPDVGR